MNKIDWENKIFLNKFKVQECWSWPKCCYRRKKYRVTLNNVMPCRSNQWFISESLNLLLNNWRVYLLVNSSTRESWAILKQKKKRKDKRKWQHYTIVIWHKSPQKQRINVNPSCLVAKKRTPKSSQLQCWKSSWQTKIKLLSSLSDIRKASAELFHREKALIEVELHRQ